MDDNPTTPTPPVPEPIDPTPAPGQGSAVPTPESTDAETLTPQTEQLPTPAANVDSSADATTPGVIAPAGGSSGIRSLGQIVGGTTGEAAPAASTSSRVTIGASTHRPKLTQQLAVRQRARLIAIAAVALLAIAVIALVAWYLIARNNNATSLRNSRNYVTTSVPLAELRSQELALDKASQLSINGQLRINNSFVLTPTDTPANPLLGQFYLNSQNRDLYYYNGVTFVNLATGDDVTNIVNSLGSVSKTTPGTGLAISGGKLNNTGVLSLQGTANQINLSASTGNITVSLPQDIAPGSSPTFAGVQVGTLTARPGDAGLTVGSSTQNLSLQGANTVISDTNGAFTNTLGFESPTANHTITIPNPVSPSDTVCLVILGNCGGSGGGVTTTGGTQYTIPIYNSANNIGNSIITQDAGATTVTIGGNLTVTGTITDVPRLSGVNIFTGANTFGSQIDANGGITTNNANITTGTGTISGNGSGLTNLNGSNITSGTVSDLRLSPNVTLQGNSFNGTSQLVQTTVLGALPALSGTNLTNLNGSAISSGTIDSNRLDSTTVTLQGNVFNGVNQLVQLNGSGQLPAVSGALVTNLNASNVNTGTLSILYGGTGANDAPTARSNLGAAASGVNSDITSLTGVTSINPTSNLTVGSTSHNLVLQGSTTTLSQVSGGFTATLAFATPTVNQTITIPDAPGGTGTICLVELNNCSTGGTGANTALSNLSSVAINTDLLPGTAGGVNLGSNSKSFGALFLTDAAGHAYQFTGAATDSNKTITIPSFAGATASLCLSTGNCAGSGSGVTTTGGTTNTIPIYSGSQIIGNSIITQDVGATTVTIGGALSVTGAETVTGQLNANGGIVTNNANINAGSGTISGNGSGLTNLNGSNISTGTVADLRLSPNVTLQGNTFNGSSQLVQTTAGGLLPALNASNLTNLNGSNITTGTISDARLSSNVAFLANNQTFSGTNNFRTLSNSATAFQIQSAGGSLTLFNADTTGSGALTFGVPASFSSTVAVTGQLNANGGLATNGANITTTGGTINGQTISSAASFTGTVALATLGATGNTPVCLNLSNQLSSCGSNVNTVTLQQAYNASTVPQIVLNSTNGGIAVRDASTPIGGNLLAVQSNNGGTSYLAVTTNGVSVAGALSVTLNATVGGIFVANGSGDNASIPGALFKNASDSTNAFQIQSSSAGVLFDADTTNKRIGIGTAAPTAKLDVQTANNIGLNVNETGTNNILQLQSGGVNVATVASAGATTFKNSTNSGAAFQVQNSAGAPILNVDSASQSVSVGATSLMGFSVNTAFSGGGSSPNKIVTGDFNGDGLPDVAVLALNGTNLVAIYINTGTGLPSSANYSFNAVSGSQTMVAGDFDGDGKTDLAIGKGSAGGVGVYISTGTLPSTPTYSLTTSSAGAVNSLVTGDFNGDGKTDLVVLNNGFAGAQVYINTGSALPTAVTYSLSGLSNAQGLVIGDFNGDGKTDLAVGASGSFANISIFTNSGTTLPSSASYTIGTSFLNNPYSLAVGDFNGDGKTDLAATNSGSLVNIFTNSGTTLPASVSYTLNLPYSSTGAISITTGDFNGDGKTDLAVGQMAPTGFDTISVFTNTNSSLPTTPSLTQNGLGSGATSNPVTITTGDYNVDGRTDIAISNFGTTGANALTMFTNTGPPGRLNVSPITSTSVGEVVQGVNGQTADLLQLQGYGNVVLAEFTASGALQAGNGSGTNASGTNLVLNGGQGTGIGAGGNINLQISKPASGFGASLNSETTVASLSGTTGAATFKNATDSGAGFQIQNSAGTSLFNADTASSAITIGAIPSTGFATAVNSTSTNQPRVYGTAVADFNLDGKPDLAVANGSNVDVYINNGTSLPASPNYTLTASNPGLIAVGDFNNDGKPDLAVASGGTTVIVFINSGTALPTTGTYSLTGMNGPTGIASADFNGDGFADLIVTNAGASTTFTFINTGGGSPALPTTKTQTLTGTGASPASVVAADFNGDGKTDVAVSSDAGKISVFTNGGAALPTSPTYQLTGLSAPDSMVVTDINSDGKPDLISNGGTGGSGIGVFINPSGTLPSTPTYYLSTTTAGQSLAVGDFNADGRPDLATGNFVNAFTGTTASIYMNNNNTLNTTATYQLAGLLGPQSAAAADFTNDSRTDVAFGNAGNLTVSLFANTGPPGRLSVSSISAAAVGVVVQGVASQTADLFQAQNTGGTILTSITAAGALQGGNGIGTNAAGQNLVLAGGQGTGTAVGGTITFQVAKPGSSGSTTNALATAASISGTDGSALFKNTTDSSTGFQVQTTGSVAVLSVNTSTSTVTVKALVVNPSLTVNGHIITGNTSGSTSGAVQAAAGTGGSPTCTVTGNDTGGQITLTTGTASWATGEQCRISFATVFAASPHPVVTIASATDTTTVKPYVTTSLSGGTNSAGYFSINFIAADTAQHTYTWNYFNAQ